MISQLNHVMSTSIQVKSVEPELASGMPKTNCHYNIIAHDSLPSLYLEYHGKSSIVHQKKSGKVITKVRYSSLVPRLPLSVSTASDNGRPGIEAGDNSVYVMVSVVIVPAPPTHHMV